MASVYKRRFEGPDGQSVECSTYTVTFQDCSDPHREKPIPRSVAGFIDKANSTEMGNKLERLATFLRAGEPVKPDLQAYLDGLPLKVRRKLVKWGLLSTTADATGTPLEAHLAAYQQALEAGIASRKQKGRPATAQHVQKTLNRVRWLVKHMEARVFGDIRPERIASALSQLEAKGLRSKGLGSKTLSHYWSALYSFLAWAQRKKLIHRNPMEGTARPDPDLDPRHRRIAFESQEVGQLLNAARSGDPRFDMSGEERFWLYRLAVETGCRQGELRGLVRSNLNLDSSPPLLTVPAKVAKSRRERAIPLKPDTAVGLKAFLGTKLPTAQVFSNMPRAEKVVIMLRGDLAKAEIPYHDDAGRCRDFHGLRATFATNLVRAGVDVKTAMELLGHTTADMTLRVYAKVLRGGQQAAIAKLPNFDGSTDEQAATGTDGKAAEIASARQAGDAQKTAVKTAARPMRRGAKTVHDGANTEGVKSEPGSTINSYPPKELRRFPMHGRELCSASAEVPPRGFEPLSPG